MDVSELFLSCSKPVFCFICLDICLLWVVVDVAISYTCVDIAANCWAVMYANDYTLSSISVFNGPGLIYTSVCMCDSYQRIRIAVRI